MRTSTLFENLDVFESVPFEGRAVIVLIHGGPGMDHSYFDALVDEAKSFTNVVSYRQGSSGARTMNDLLKEFDAVVSRYKGKRIFVLGHSWGAALALEAAARGLLNSIAGLILVSPLFDTDWSRPFTDTYADRMGEIRKNLTKSEALDPASDDYYRELSMALVDLYFEPPSIEQGIQLFGSIRYDRSLQQALYAEYLSSFDLKPLVQSLDTPTLVVTGRNDQVTTLPYVSTLSVLNSRIRIAVMEETSHFPFVEKPKRFIDLIRSFIEPQPKETI